MEAARKHGRPPGPAARKYLKQVIDEYPTTPAAAEARNILTELDAADAREWTWLCAASYRRSADSVYNARPPTGRRDCRANRPPSPVLAY
jgi:hypothetical protein